MDLSWDFSLDDGILSGIWLVWIEVSHFTSPACDRYGGGGRGLSWKYSPAGVLGKVYQGYQVHLIRWLSTYNEVEVGCAMYRMINYCRWINWYPTILTIVLLKPWKRDWPTVNRHPITNLRFVHASSRSLYMSNRRGHVQFYYTSSGSVEITETNIL